jgi:hypothetical protein
MATKTESSSASAPASMRPNIADTDLPHTFRRASKRSLSAQLLCIALAIDAHKDPVTVACSHGKPSTKRTKGLPLEPSEGCHDPLRQATRSQWLGRRSLKPYRADVAERICLENMGFPEQSFACGSNATSGTSQTYPRPTCKSYLNWQV